MVRNQQQKELKMKKIDVRNLVNSLKLASSMLFVTLTGCCYNCGCRDCGEQEKDTVYVVKEKPCDEKCDCNKNCGCGKKQCDCKKTQPKTQPKTEPKTEPKQEPKSEPKPEPECKTVTTTTYEHFCISGDANDVINAAIGIVNSNHR